MHTLKVARARRGTSSRGGIHTGHKLQQQQHEARKRMKKNKKKRVGKTQLLVSDAEASKQASSVGLAHKRCSSSRWARAHTQHNSVAARHHQERVSELE